MSIIAPIVKRLVEAGAEPATAASCVVEAYEAGRNAIGGVTRFRPRERPRALLLRSVGWPKLRLEILERDQRICAYCLDDANQVDHIFPRSRGGGNEPSNLTAACGRCNISKGRLTPEEWSARDKFALPPWFYERRRNG